MAFGSLGAVLYSIVAEDKTAAGLDSAKEKFRKFGTAAGAAMTGIGAAAMLAGDQVNSAYADIRIGTGATGEALEGLKEDFHAVFGAIPGDAATVSGALAAMNTTTGATGETLQDLTTNILEVSRMLGEDGAGNAQTFGEAMKQWQIPAADGITLMDQFFKITQETGIGFGELTGAMNAYGPVLQNAGFTAAESADLFGKLEGSGIAVSRVMPGLNSAFRKWAEEGVDSKKALGGVIEEIGNAETEMEALTIATETFGAEGAQRMTTAIRNNVVDLTTLGGTLIDTDGLIAETAEGTLTLSDKFGLLKTQLTETLAPFEGVGAAMTVAGPALMGLSNMGPAITAVKGMGGAMKGLSLTMLAPPMGIIIAIGAAIAILFVLEQKFGLVSKAADVVLGAFKSVGEFFTGVFTSAIEGAQSVIGLFGDKLLFFLGPIGAVIYAFKHWDEIAPMIKEALTKVYDFITEPFIKAYDWLTGLPGEFMAAGEALIQAIIDGINKLISKPKELIEDALNKVRNLFPFSDAKEGPLSDLTYSGKSLVKTFSAGIESESGNLASSFSAGIAPMAPAATPASSGGDTYAGDTWNVGPNYLSKDYDFPALMKDIEAHQSQKRVQRGIRTI